MWCNLQQWRYQNAKKCQNGPVPYPQTTQALKSRQRVVCHARTRQRAKTAIERERTRGEIAFNRYAGTIVNGSALEPPETCAGSD
jgi:hypothetical protein